MSIKSEINFSIKFLNTLNASNKPTIFSPASILSSLAIIYVGSDNLKNQFNQLLDEEIDSMKFLKYYSKFVKFCLSSSNLNDLYSKILLSNRLFLSSKKVLNQNFVETVTNEFCEEAFEQIDFSLMDVPKSKAAKLKAAKKICEKINNFVNEKTEGNIKEIIKEDEIYPTMNILISNAACIVAKWEEPFQDPIFAPFYSSLTIQKSIPMFSKNILPGGCSFTKGKNWKCLGLPYKTRNIWLHILLPNQKDGLPYILEKLNYSFIKKCIKSNNTGGDETIRAMIPAFKIEDTSEITNNLGRSGLTLIFHNEEVNLMFENDQANVDRVLHKVLFSVDKNGSFESDDIKLPTINSALSSDNVDVASDQCSNSTEHFIADHPFLFFVSLVRDQNPEKLKNILFMGTFC